MTPVAFDEDTELLARTYNGLLLALGDEFVERHEVVRLLGIASLCREHVLVIGPPGTAKTSLLDRFCRMLDVTPFTYLLTRFTEPAELFGPIDIRKFQDDKVYELNTTGMLPEAEVAFLDEVFQGSSAILNTLLTLINERRFFNGSQTVEVPLVTLLGATNDVPDDVQLRAFSDRFLLRAVVSYLPNDELSELLRIGWRNEQAAIDPELAPLSGLDGRFSLDDLRVLQQELAQVDLSGLLPTYNEVLAELRADGVTFSDRRAVKALKVFAAEALLDGRVTAEPADLWPLIHLWTEPRDRHAIERLVEIHGITVPGGARSSMRTLDEIRDELNVLIRDREALRSPEDARALLQALSRLAAELRRDHPATTGPAAELLREVGREHAAGAEWLRDHTTGED